ncbi:helix-hairpin-helix domain-containing protein [Streptomyces apocyni]|uniref:helix-hairpin-helix domain-containing protein n=1 Tax=Streptomyces apocyni TaxID=2654677 RepID=UPI0012E99F1B
MGGDHPGAEAGGPVASADADAGANSSKSAESGVAEAGVRAGAREVEADAVGVGAGEADEGAGAGAGAGEADVDTGDTGAGTGAGGGEADADARADAGVHAGEAELDTGDASAGGGEAEADAVGAGAGAGGGEAEMDAAGAGAGAGGGEAETDAVGAGAGSGEAGEGGVSEAEAELAAQRALRERIERRKAEREAPVESGTKLSGQAADLLAAVRAVESGAKPVAAAFREPAPAPSQAVAEPVRRAAPEQPVGGAGPASETVAAVAAVLAEGGAPEAFAGPAAAVLGVGAEGQLRNDPWLLLRAPGVRPEQADVFARALLGDACGPDDERRGRAVAVWLLEQAALAGHTVLDAAALAAALGQRGVPDPDAAVQSAIAEGDVLLFQDALEEEGAGAPADPDEERPVRVRVGLERCALAEESLADGLARIVNSLAKEDDSEQARWEAAAGGGAAAKLLRAVAGHGLVLHTGGEAARAEPAALVDAAQRLGLRVCAATHSADGRDRFARLLAADGPEGGPEGGPFVTTVAGLLSGAEGPGRDAEGAWAVDLLVLLDAPQLDVETAAMLVESLPEGARLLLSGDPGVLWSAGAGRVFADLLAAQACPHIVSRTPDPGPLGELVSGIGIGELNQVAAPGKEVVIVPVRDAGEAVHRTVQLVADSVPRAIGIPAEHTQVITPGHGGAAGTRVLNAALKERLNPGPGRFGGFDPGDRIVHTPAPGRTAPGRVIRADAEGLHLDCAGTPVVVPKERVEQTVRHGWALTAHQAVGQRWPAAVVVLPGDEVRALTRAWVYTAFGRAERHLSVVHGVEQALARAVAEVPAKERHTRLRTLLSAQVPAAG